MRIATKYDIGDRVFYTQGVDIRSLIVNDISIKIRTGGIEIHYCLTLAYGRGYTTYNEVDLYMSKADAMHCILMGWGE